MNNSASFVKAILRITGCFFFVIFLAGSAFAQTRGKVEVIKDPRVDSLIAKRADLEHSLGIDQVMGFRVQIFTGSNRKNAYDAQARFQQQFPDIRSYIIYNEPNFKVRVGDFRTRLEAERFQEDLKKFFDGTFIITEKVNPPKPNNDND
ncbi:MAG TPA: SPOR domain-containing protein [Mucilaginibacter sp.]|nr:SPOR domain-containing protein [Mucilaginibacter sp.]